MEQNEINIVIADPDKEDAMILKEALKTAGISTKVAVFQDGKPLLAHLNSNPLPGVIFLDINTPPPDGRQTLEEIRINPAFDEVPVIIFTGSEMAVNINESRSLGANLYVQKPTDLNRLQQLLKNLFSGNWKERLLKNGNDNFVIK